jgi:Histidine kinase-, DNA gyrase B-, and HSP90-like ATPase
MPPSDSLDYDVVAPEPSALIESLRSVGYNLPTAIADIIDNSIAAKAKVVDIVFHWAGQESCVAIFDDGRGMTQKELVNAMRPGSRNPLEERQAGDLGRFGLGLKTASLSQCRIISVASKAKGEEVHARTWDLDVLATSPEWRLLIGTSKGAAKFVEQLKSRLSGTAVVWTNLDRVIGDEHVDDAAAHNRFNDAISHVREHLSLTFHRFIEEGSITINLNGRKIAPWNPFMILGRGPSWSTPSEFIQFGKSGLKFQGYVLPHKDQLSEEEFQANRGPRGWTGQQGFYVYRNKRLLVYGDWLRLGRPSAWTREEQFRLARIRLDISNDADADWHLDVKKSTARPPALIRDRLTDLAEHVRQRARGVFVHRGRYGTRIATEKTVERAWKSSVRENRRIYSINREHPFVAGLIKAHSDIEPELEMLFRVLEETVPIQQIWLDSAEQTHDHAAPYQGLEFSTIKADMNRVLNLYRKSGINIETAKERLRTMEPFDRYSKLINEL